MATRFEGDGRQGTLAGLWLDKKPKSKPVESPPVRVTPVQDVTPAPQAVAPSLPVQTPVRPLIPGSALAPWSVRALVSSVRQQVESGFADVWVQGEISNCRPAPSGHIYFTLKDGEAQLPVVLFRRQAQLLRFRPLDGLAVLVRGRISVYESRGQLQLIAETLEPRGAGALQLAFDQLKARLLAEGLFDAARKRPLPPFPHCIGVVTSMGGAVIHDIIRVVRRRHARLNLLVFDATVQGPGCAASIAAGIRFFNRHAQRAQIGVQIILIARGGGSLEDLAGFNDEGLARTIAGSALPVVSAIGHETDFTIADFVADLRAPTPSAAAEIITASQHRVEEQVAALAARLRRAIRYQVIVARQRYAGLTSAQILTRTQFLLGRRQQRLDDLRRRLTAAPARRLRVQTMRLSALTARLQPHNPALRLAVARRRLDAANACLRRIARNLISVRTAPLTHATSRLEAMSPLAVLQRGYALVYLEDGTLLTSAADVQPGQRIRARLARGSVAADVTGATTEN